MIADRADRERGWHRDWPQHMVGDVSIAHLGMGPCVDFWPGSGSSLVCCVWGAWHRAVCGVSDIL